MSCEKENRSPLKQSVKWVKNAPFLCYLALFGVKRLRHFRALWGFRRRSVGGRKDFFREASLNIN